MEGFGLQTHPATAHFVPWPLKDLGPCLGCDLKTTEAAHFCPLCKQTSTAEANTSLLEVRSQQSQRPPYSSIKAALLRGWGRPLLGQVH